MLSLSLGLAVWSDFEKQPTSATGQILEGRVNILARGPFCAKNGSRKKCFCDGMILWWGLRGFHLTQMNSVVRGLGVNYRDLILSKELCLISGFFAFLCIFVHCPRQVGAFLCIFMHFLCIFMHFLCIFMHFLCIFYAFLCIFVHYPQVVLDHNLCYMAPFAIPRAGFCIEFRRASFIFSCPGVDFGTTGQIFRPWGQISRPWG